MANIISIETEREILRLRAEGMSFKAISPLVGVSHSTIRNVVLRGCVRSDDERERINRGSRDEWCPTPEFIEEMERRKREIRIAKGDWIETTLTQRSK